MFLKERGNGHLVEIIDLEELFDSHQRVIKGRYQIGEADQDDDLFAKSRLIFLSGEELPQCWIK